HQGGRLVKEPNQSRPSLYRAPPLFWRRGGPTPRRSPTWGQRRAGAEPLPPAPALAYPGPMTPADLVEIALIERLKYRYMRCLDQKLWDEMAECFTADAIVAYSGGKYTFEGRDAILEFFRQAMGATSFLSSHRVHH